MRQRRSLGIEYRGKRAFDFIIAGAACVIFVPLVAGVAIAIWLEDRGTPLFRQPRLGGTGCPNYWPAEGHVQASAWTGSICGGKAYFWT